MRSTSSYAGLAFIGGIAAGYLVSLMLPESQHRKHQRTLKKSVNSIDWDSLSQKVLGISSKEAVAKVKSNLEQFQKTVEKTFTKAKSFDDKKYKNLVKQFGARLEADKTFTQDQIRKLTSYLESDYRDIAEAA